MRGGSRALNPRLDQPSLTEMRTAMVCALFIGVGPISLSLYSPALPALVAIFNTTPAAMKLTVTAYFLGFAFALLLCGPLSDAFGRRPVMLGFFSIYLVGSLGAAAASSIEWLLAGRVLQGIGAAAGVTTSRALVRDLFAGQTSARIMNRIGLMMGIAPAVAPTIGAVLLSTLGWHAIFLAMVLYGLGVLAAAYRLPETHADADSTLIRPRRISESYGMLLRDRGFLRAGIVLGLVFGGLYTMPALLPFALIERVGLTPVQFGLAMLGHTGAYLLGTFVTGRLLRRFDAMKLGTVGVALVLAAGAMFAIGLSVLPPSLPTVWVPAALWVFGLAFIGPGATTNALAGFPAIAGSAGALLGFMQFGGGLVGTTIAAAVLTDAISALMILMPAMAVLAALAHVALSPRGERVSG